jgi:hypothetical protein
MKFSQKQSGHPNVGGSRLLGNVGTYIPIYTASYLRTLEYS